jgi:hypothetical protein
MAFEAQSSGAPSATRRLASSSAAMMVGPRWQGDAGGATPPRAYHLNKFFHPQNGVPSRQ